MEGDFVSLLDDYCRERYFELSDRLVGGAAFAGSDYKPSKNEKMLRIVYELKGSKNFPIFDSYGSKRGTNKDGEAVKVNTTELVSAEEYSNGNKVKFLRTVLNSVFDNYILDEHVLPGEVMNVMKDIFNVSFNAYEQRDDDTVYINPNTFRSVFYQVKKEFRNKNIEKVNSTIDYESMKKVFTHILRQDSVLEKDRVNVNFGRITPEELVRMLPKLSALKNYGKLEELDKNLGRKRDYSIVKELNPSFVEHMYPHLFSQVYSRVMDKVYNDSLNNMSAEGLGSFFDENQNLIEFDSNNSLENMDAKIPIINIEQVITELLGYEFNPNNFGIISGMIVEELSEAMDPNNPLTLKKIKDFFDYQKDLESLEEVFEKDDIVKPMEFISFYNSDDKYTLKEFGVNNIIKILDKYVFFQTLNNTNMDNEMKDNLKPASAEVKKTAKMIVNNYSKEFFDYLDDKKKVFNQIM